MKIKELTINRLKHHSFSEQYKIFFCLYKKLFLPEELNNSDRTKILSLAVLFSNQKEEVMRRLGYRIVLSYGNKTHDFTPLYDIAINSGLIPIAALIKGIEDLPINKISVENDSFISNIELNRCAVALTRT